MNDKIRTLIFSVVAAVLLPFVFVAVQGILARQHANSILALTNIIGSSAAVHSIIYGYGILGSALSATLIALPLGLLLTRRPWLFGAAVGIVFVVQLALESRGIALSNSVEYLSLIGFSSLAADVGSRI